MSTRQTSTGHTLRLVTDTPSALDIEVARIRAERRERRALAAARLALLEGRRETWLERVRRWRG